LSRYRTAHDVLRAEIDGQEVLLNTKTGEYHLVNSTGRAILVSLEEGQTLQDSAAEVAAEAGEDLGRVADEANVFVHAMCERGLLEEIE